MESKISTEYDGKKRTLYKCICLICNKEFWVPNTRLRKGQKFCSPACSNKHKRQISNFIVTCAYCHSQIQKKNSAKKNSKSGLFFCNRFCKEKAQSIEGGVISIQPAHYNNGIFNYRDKALRYYGSKCSKCFYSGSEQMLDVDHIDSNRSNNSIENLQVLCVWCHALKTRKVPEHLRLCDKSYDHGNKTGNRNS